MAATHHSTTQERIETDLRDSWLQLRLHHTEVLTNTGTVIWNVRTDSMELSPNMYVMAGIDASETDLTLDSLIDRAVHPEDREQARAAVAEQLKSRANATIEYRLVRPDGDIRFMEAHCRFLDDNTALAVHHDVTEKQAAKAACQRTRQERDTILNNSSELYVLYDPEMRIIWANRAAESTAAKESGELVGERCFDIWGDGVKPCTDCPVLQARELGRPTVQERRDQKGAWWQIRCVPLFDQAGGIAQVIEYSTDISEIKRIEQTLRESESKLQSIVSAAKDAIVMMDADGRISTWNAAAAQMFGHTEREALGRALHDLVAPSRYLEHFRRAFSVFKGSGRGNAIGRVVELTAVRKGGQEFPIELSLSAVKLDEQWHAIGIVRDIAERRSSEEALRESEERLRNIVEHSTNLFYSHTADHRLTYLSPQTENFFDCSPEEAYERWTEFVTDNPINEKGFEHTVRAIRTGQAQPPYELECRGLKGRVIWVEVHEAPIVENGKTVAIVGALVDITQRKKSEQAQKAANAQFRRVTDAMDAILYVVDMETYKPLFMNERARKDVGYYGSLDGRKCWEIFQSDQSGPCQFCTNDKLVDADGNPTGPYVWEFQNTRTGRWFMCRDEAIEWVDGRLVRLEIATDITERKQTEAALAESEAKYRLLFDHSEAAVSVYDRDGVCLLMNNVVAGFFGGTPEDFVGKTLHDLHPEQGALYTERIRRAIDTGTAHDFEDEVDFAGHKRWLISTVHPVLDANEQTYAAQIISHDVTERNQAVIDLRASEERFKSYVTHAPHALFVVDGEGRYIDVNEAAVSLTGYSRDELLTMQTMDLVPEDQPLRRREFMALLEDEGYVRTEGPIRCKDGSTKWTSLDAVKLSSDLIMGFRLDMTETKRLRELESKAQRLETAGQIAGQVAHDFNNLLGPLIAYPDFIREELPGNHPALTYLSDIEKSANVIADINQQLLTLGRRGHYNQEALNLNEIVHHVIRDTNVDSDTLTIDLQLAADLMPIKAGRAQLHRALSNLVQNAVDAMEGIGRLTVISENYYVDEVTISYGRVPKGEYTKLTIEDTGGGIPKEIVDKVFDPFFTTKTTDRKRGSGLGLSVVDAVVKDHGGFLDLKSSPGKGTAFYLYFPITREEASEPLSSRAIGGSESILVVDDDSVQREVSSKLLKRLGYQVRVASSGAEAIELLKRQPCDLIILDMVMPPGIDGTETLRRALEISPNQRAIVVSGYSETERVLEAQRLGAGAFVRKPLTMGVLARAVRKELNRSRVHV